MNLPSISFVIPVYNSSRYLRPCLQSILEQDYPREKLEIVVVDGGSQDDTVAVARSFDTKVLHNPFRIADRGNYIGIREAKGDYVVIMAADNRLPLKTWLRKMVIPFLENPRIAAAFPLPEPYRDDPPINVYFNLMKTDPLTFFVFESPGTLERHYSAVSSGEGYVVYRFPADRPPFIGLAQGFTVKRDLIPESVMVDDVAPFLQLVERGYEFAVLKGIGIHHFHLESLASFARKYAARALSVQMHSNDYRRLLFAFKPRIVKIRLWLLYSLTFIWPAIDSGRNYRKTRQVAWFYHPITCFLITMIYLLCGMISLKRLMTSFRIVRGEPGTR